MQEKLLAAEVWFEGSNATKATCKNNMIIAR
jgi:hypothetical protein